MIPMIHHYPVPKTKKDAEKQTLSDILSLTVGRGSPQQACMLMTTLSADSLKSMLQLEIITKREYFEEIERRCKHTRKVAEKLNARLAPSQGAAP